MFLGASEKMVLRDEGFLCELLWQRHTVVHQNPLILFFFPQGVSNIICCAVGCGRVTEL